MTAPACALATALLVAPVLARGAGGTPPIAFTAEAALSRFPQAPRLAAGGVVSARLAFAEAALVADWALRAPSGDVGLASEQLLAAGWAHDLGPRASVHALAAAGSYRVRLRDFVYGGWRERPEVAWGGRAGIRLHPEAVLGRMGGGGLRPVGGLWLTVLRVGRGSDRLRAAEWGGTLAVLTLSVGLELAGSRRPAGAP